MSEIQYMEKPDWVSWEDVRVCVNAAHQANKKKGFEMTNAAITTDELIKKNKGAHCFIALDNNKVIGVASVRIQKKRRWWVNGLVVYYFCDAILPEYRGTDVYFDIHKLIDQFVKESGVKIHFFHTHEHNKVVIKMNKKYGFKMIQLTPGIKGLGYYQVSMAKWDDGCPWPDWYLNFMFNLSKIVSKILWKPGYKWRFWFN